MALGLAVALPVAAHRQAEEGMEEKLLRVEDPIPGHYIVVLKGQDGVTGTGSGPQPGPAPPALAVAARDQAAVRAAIGRAAQGVASDYGVPIGRLYTDALGGFAAAMSKDQARAVSLDPRVAFVEEDGVVS